MYTVKRNNGDIRQEWSFTLINQALFLDRYSQLEKITALEFGVEGIGDENEEKNIPKSLDSSPEGCTFDVQ